MIKLFRKTSYLVIVLLQLLLPTLIAAEVRCWIPGASGKLVFKECKDAIVQVTQTRDPKTRQYFDPTLPLTFAREKSLRPDIVTPKHWDTGESNCLIGVDIPEAQGGMDKTSLQDIRNAAFEVAVQCVIGGGHLGGANIIGWQEKITVVVTSLSTPDRLRASKKHSNGTVEEA
ncbi:MAG: hypothetical protein L6R40_007363 [Gallowayella cf. fulva]|nr:MAG: hypothetical protein L6R40_007363 [Xanthomendoza cf. fulva]